MKNSNITLLEFLLPAAGPSLQESIQGLAHDGLRFNVINGIVYQITLKHEKPLSPKWLEEHNYITKLALSEKVGCLSTHHEKSVQLRMMIRQWRSRLSAYKLLLSKSDLDIQTAAQSATYALFGTPNTRSSLKRWLLAFCNAIDRAIDELPPQNSAPFTYAYAAADHSHKYSDLVAALFNKAIGYQNVDPNDVLLLCSPTTESGRNKLKNDIARTLHGANQKFLLEELPPGTGFIDLSNDVLFENFVKNATCILQEP